MVLTHIYEIQENGWKHVQAEEMFKKYKKVPLSEHRLICTLCLNYVTQAYGTKNGYYFKHGKQVECIEKTEATSPGKSYKINAKKHELPLKTVFDKRKKLFSFQLGMLALPSQDLEKLQKSNTCFSIENKSGENIGSVHSFERLDNRVTTFFDIGRTPYPYYKINFKKHNVELDFNDIIPLGVKVAGIDLNKINLFKTADGRKISEFGNVQVGEEYYVVYKSSLPLNLPTDNRIFFKNLCKQGSWKLGIIKINGISADLIKYFLEQHYYLEKKPISITPIWPPYIENGEEIFFENSINFFIHGEDDVVYSMSNRITRPLYKEYESENGYLLSRISSAFKNGVVAVGRQQVAKYFVLRSLDELKDGTKQTEEIKVTDLKNKVLRENVYFQVPEKSTLRIYAEYDGKIECYHNNILKNSIVINGGETKTVKNIRMNDQVRVYQNLDCVKRISFQEDKRLGNHCEDQRLLLFLKKCSGKKILVNHDFAGIIAQMTKFPLSQEWVYSTLRSGSMNIKAYKTLKNKFI